MQQLSKSYLDIPWDQLGLEVGDIVIFKTKSDAAWSNKNKYRVMVISPQGMVVACLTDGSVSSPDRFSLAIMSVVKCSN
jgi:hypothetical protein